MAEHDRRGGGSRDPRDPTGMLAVLDEPFVFTQRAALTVSDFNSELRERGVAWPEGGELEAFHRAGLLVPIYSIRYDPKLIRERAATDGRQVNRNDIRAALDFTNTYGYGLIGEREIGDLRIPAADGYTPWRSDLRTSLGRPYRTKQYLYSRYQLLAAPMLQRLWPRLRRVRATWRLDISDRVLELTRGEGEYYARLVRPLTILEAIYLPDILENVSMPGFGDFDEWDQFRAKFDPAPVLDRIGWTAEQVLKDAESLLARGHGLDPTAAWHELTRLIHPSHWKKLKGDARTAMDFRIAGELLLRFYEDLAGKGAAPPLEAPGGRSWHPRHERLKTDRTELDATLSRFGLSPHAPAVLILEGKTEQAIVPFVMDLLYRPSWRNRIRLFDVQGADQNLDALAAYAAVPALTESEREVIVLAHPPTHFVVLSDAEGKNASKHAREQRRRRWVKRIYEALPFHMRDEVDLGELDGLVHIFVWDESGSDFERSHFTDEELADGLLAIAPHGPKRHDLLSRLAQSRRDRTNLRKVWHEWGAPPRPQKPRLARHLWPVLSVRIEAALDSATPIEVPIVRVLRDVMGIARTYPRHYQIVMRRRPKPAAQSLDR